MVLKPDLTDEEFERILERLEAEEQASRVDDPEGLRTARRRAAHAKRIENVYGMTPADYQAMYRIQEGRCAICRKAQERLSVDHCHETLRIRGLLCSRCNLALGTLQENLSAARGMAVYIERRCIPTKQAGLLVGSPIRVVSRVTKSRRSAKPAETTTAAESI